MGCPVKRLAGLVLLLMAVVCASVVPAAANGWFPKINGKGEIASGMGEIFVDGRVVASPLKYADNGPTTIDSSSTPADAASS